MDANYQAFSTTYIQTSGSGVLGATGKPIYLQGMLQAGVSSQCITFYSGTTTVTMAICTLTGKGFLQFPMAFPGGCTYQTLGNPGDGDLRLIFFWIPGIGT